MSEYIERDSAINAVYESFADGKSPYGALISIPAADVRPVVRAAWVEEAKNSVWHEYCSNCHEHIPKGKWGEPWHSSYCPNCGAMMEES